MADVSTLPSSPALGDAAEYAGTLARARAAAPYGTALMELPQGVATALAELAQLAASAVVTPGSLGRLLSPHTLAALAAALAKAGVRCHGEDDAPSLPSLPLALQAAVLQHVPPDQRLLLNRVSPAFKAMVDQPGLWQDVRLGVGSGVGRVSDALLLAVSAKARGTMRTLDLSGRLNVLWLALSIEAVVAVCEANAATLGAVDVRCEEEDDDVDEPVSEALSHSTVVQLLAAVPRLCRLHTEVQCSSEESHTLLQSPALCVRRLRVNDCGDAASVAALLADLRAVQPSVAQLQLDCAPPLAPLNAAATLDAVVTFAAERRLCALRLSTHTLGGERATPAPIRLLRLVSLSSLALSISDALPTSPAFCAALRASTLQRLMLGDTLFAHGGSGLALLAAVTAHPTLQRISIFWNVAPEAHRAAAGAALGRLVGANAPALASLDVSFCNLGDEGLRPLVDALPANTALRRLVCSANDFTAPFTVALLAAARANTGLRALEAEDEEDTPELEEAGALVWARARAGVAVASSGSTD